MEDPTSMIQTLGSDRKAPIVMSLIPSLRPQPSPKSLSVTEDYCENAYPLHKPCTCQKTTQYELKARCTCFFR